MKIKFLFPFILLFISFKSSGQILSSRVIYKDGSAVKDAVVINITRLSTDRTENDGHFNVRADYGDSLLISNFKNKMIYVYVKDVEDIVLEKTLSPYKLLKIDDKVINQINTLYLSEKYYECIRYCSSYLDYRTYRIISEGHPYRDWGKKSFFENSDIESIASVLYLGCISAYKFSLSHRYIPFEGLQWCKAYIAFYEDYLKEKIPDSSWSAEMMSKFLSFGKWAKNIVMCGDHFLHVYDGDDKWVKKEYKWFDKKLDQFNNILYKNTVNRLNDYSEYPFIQYEISTIIFQHNLQNKEYKYFQNDFSQRIDAFIRLIKDIDNQYNYLLLEPLSSLVTTLSYSVIYNDLCKKLGNNFEAFCMEHLIKLQDVSYYLNGSSRYSLATNYNLRDIQNHLKEGDCAMIHFEAPARGYYNSNDLGTRFRNYALIITKNQERPDVWHRGYINDSIVNDIKTIKEFYPNVTRFYYVGTPRMSFIDVAGSDSSIVRLHSLSQLLQERDSLITDSEISFIGDLNYRKIGDINEFISETKGGEKFGRLKGPVKELAYINTLFSNVRPICCDDASRNVVTSEISRNEGIVHISTHGDFIGTSNDFNFQPDELILKKNVMDNSRLILSGYNDDPKSPLSYMTGSDVLKMKRINTSIVFLDACSSGNGAVGLSGSVGIAEAFHQIGAHNVICYLESINDIIATEFSNRFYLELSKGASCHDAFFTAKKSMNQNFKVVLWE
jgi:hypothetical protein